MADPAALAEKTVKYIENPQWTTCRAAGHTPYARYEKCHVCRSKTKNVDGLCLWQGRRRVAEEGLVYLSGEHEKPRYLDKWDESLEVSEINNLLVEIGTALLPILEAEVEEQKQHEGDLFRLRVELSERPICEKCRSRLFTMSWFCAHCAREWCSTCIGKQSRSPCISGQLKRCTRVPKTLLKDTVKNIKAVLESTERIFPNKPEVTPDGEALRVAYPPRDLALWHSHLHHGVPLVVTGCTEVMQHKYGPQYFLDHTELDTITVVSIQDGVKKEVSASAFFASVLAGDEEAAKYKVKDFPSATHFKELFPSLFKELEPSWPYPSYVRANGKSNLLSACPTNPDAINPDVGPKGYNCPRIEPGSASTGIHMDHMDAWNVLHWLARDWAEWYLFPADSSAILRQYIKDKGKTYSGDPIHSGTVCLSEDDIDELKERGIRPWVVQQRAGEAVFVPSGCPHQVRNLSWCFKLAIDFLSAEALPRTQIVQSELREQRLDDPTLEDVVQLPLVMWHAWQAFWAERVRLMSEQSRSTPTVGEAKHMSRNNSSRVEQEAQAEDGLPSHKRARVEWT